MERREKSNFFCCCHKSSKTGSQRCSCRVFFCLSLVHCKWKWNLKSARCKCFTLDFPHLNTFKKMFKFMDSVGRVKCRFPNGVEAWINFSKQQDERREAQVHTTNVRSRTFSCREWKKSHSNKTPRCMYGRNLILHRVAEYTSLVCDTTITWTSCKHSTHCRSSCSLHTFILTPDAHRRQTIFVYEFSFLFFTYRFVFVPAFFYFSQ